jgi:xanthine dehydrogenase YagR molybdenum-binding subunit
MTSSDMTRRELLELTAATGSALAGEQLLFGAAAITNAIFHATGKRIRELPVTPDKLL